MQFCGSFTRRRGPPRVTPLELGRSPRGGGAESGHGRGAPTPLVGADPGPGPQPQVGIPTRGGDRGPGYGPQQLTPGGPQVG